MCLARKSAQGTLVTGAPHQGVPGSLPGSKNILERSQAKGVLHQLDNVTAVVYRINLGGTGAGMSGKVCIEVGKAIYNPK